MRRRIVVTDVTRMQGERVCVAGYLLDGDEPARCVRPEFRRGQLSEWWLMNGREAVVRPFNLIELDLQQPKPAPPHTEDWLVDERYRVGRGRLAPEARLTLLADLDDGGVDRIFGAPIHADHGWFVTAGEGTRSLGTVRPDAVLGLTFAPRPRLGKWDYRLEFADTDGRIYKLPVTDLAFRYHLDRLRDADGLPPPAAAGRVLATLRAAGTVYLRVGLGRGFGERADRCHLQINGVYAFPDYLDGRCFADLAPPGRYEIDLSEVPF